LDELRWGISRVLGFSLQSQALENSKNASNKGKNPEFDSLQIVRLALPHPVARIL
jgi:hypothetical protein